MTLNSNMSATVASADPSFSYSRGSTYLGQANVIGMFAVGGLDDLVLDDTAVSRRPMLPTSYQIVMTQYRECVSNTKHRGDWCKNSSATVVHPDYPDNLYFKKYDKSSLNTNGTLRTVASFATSESTQIQYTMQDIDTGLSTYFFTDLSETTNNERIISCTSHFAKSAASPDLLSALASSIHYSWQGDNFMVNGVAARLFYIKYFGSGDEASGYQMYEWYSRLSDNSLIRFGQLYAENTPDSTSLSNRVHSFYDVTSVSDNSMNTWKNSWPEGWWGTVSRSDTLLTCQSLCEVADEDCIIGEYFEYLPQSPQSHHESNETVTNSSTTGDTVRARRLATMPFSMDRVIAEDEVRVYHRLTALYGIDAVNDAFAEWHAHLDLHNDFVASGGADEYRRKLAHYEDNNGPINPLNGYEARQLAGCMSYYFPFNPNTEWYASLIPFSKVTILMNCNDMTAVPQIGTVYLYFSPWDTIGLFSAVSDLDPDPLTFTFQSLGGTISIGGGATYGIIGVGGAVGLPPGWAATCSKYVPFFSTVCKEVLGDWTVISAFISGGTATYQQDLGTQTCTTTWYGSRTCTENYATVPYDFISLVLYVGPNGVWGVTANIEIQAKFVTPYDQIQFNIGYNLGIMGWSQDGTWVSDNFML